VGPRCRINLITENTNKKKYIRRGRFPEYIKSFNNTKNENFV